MRVRALIIVLVCMALPMFCYASDKIAAGEQAANELGFKAVNKWGSPGGITMNLTDPIMNGTMLMPLDDAKSTYQCPSTGKSFKDPNTCNQVCPEICVKGFSVSGVFNSSNQGEAFLEITIAPSGGGDIYPLFVRLDSDLDGTFDKNKQFSTNVSGICSDGFISCDAGTWNNCLYYSWSADNNLNVSANSVASTQVGGCYCINNSCGTMLVWNNTDAILKAIGDGIALAIQKADAQLVIKRANTDAANMRITYYGIKTDGAGAKNIDTSELNYDFRSGIDNPEQYYSSPDLLVVAGDNELTGQSGDSSSLWALTQQADTGSEQKTCTVRYDVNYSTMWSCHITCYTYHEETKLTSSRVSYLCARAYDQCSTGVYGEWYGGGRDNFPPACNPNGATQQSCSGTWSLAGTYGYSLEPPTCYARDSYGIRTGSQCPEGLKPNGTSIVGVDQYPFVTMIGKNTGALVCTWKEFWAGYVDNYYCNLAHEGAEQIGTDHSHVSSVDTCKSMDKDGCTLTYEELCDVQGNCVKTMINGHRTGLSPLETCKTVSSEMTTYDVCWDQTGSITSRNQQTGNTEILANNVDAWQVKRTYSCNTGNEYDYSGMLSRDALIEDTFSASGNMAYATFSDTVMGGSSIDVILGKSYGDCEYQCRVQAETLKTNANAVTQQGEYLAETSSVSKYSKPCRLMQDGSYSCPLEEGESQISGCVCTTNFAEAVTGLSLAKEVSQDMICSDD